MKGRILTADSLIHRHQANTSEDNYMNFGQ